MKHILEQQPSGWYVKRVDAPTAAKTFNGEIKRYDHYYRIYDKNDNPIKYCKFQQLDRLATALKVPVQDLPILN